MARGISGTIPSVMERDKTQVLQLDDLRAAMLPESAYLIVINGKAIGKMFKLVGDEMVIGRSPDAHVFLEDDGVSRRHARIERTEEGALRLVDLQSTNGTWFEGRRITDRILQDGDKIQIGSSTILKFSYQDELEERFQQQLYESATRDGLTRLYNKRFFLDRLAQEFAYALRHGEPLSLVLFDIDHFKRINDGLGHPVGDAVLQELAARVSAALRTEDVFCRFGGEEFAIIMRESTAEQAFLAAERVRRVVADAPFPYEGGALPVTISLGLATLHGGNFADANALVSEADRRLYEAKNGGRNRVGAAARLTA